MKLRWMSMVLGVVMLAAQAGAEESSVLKDQKEKVNYGMGVSIARNFKQQGIEVDLDMVIRGMRDSLEGKKLLMTDKEIRKTMSAYQSDLRQKQLKQRKMAAEDNKAAGEAFLAENRKKEGVVSLPSGLQYRILKQGDGKKPTDADSVEVSYRGTLIDGTEFDSSDPEDHATFKVKEGVIPGWSEALRLMPVGSKWQVFVPHHLAYGERGAGNHIGPYAALVFEVELLAIK